MWESVELLSDHSGFRKIASADKLQDLKTPSNDHTDGEILYFWNAKISGDPGEARRVFDEVVAANGGKKIRFFVNAKISPIDESGIGDRLCGAGSCICVQAPDEHGCELCYSNDAGSYCQSCGSDC